MGDATTTSTDPTVRITLTVVKTAIVGGDILRGVVSLHIEQSAASSSSASSSDKIKIKQKGNFFFKRYWSSLVLELEGYEHVCIVRNNNQGSGQGRRFHKYKGKHRFVHLTLPLVSSWEDDVKVDEDQDVSVDDKNNDIGETIVYQYPFEWQLPIHLPGSFWSTREEGQPRINESYCNVDYTLTAHLQPKEKEEGKEEDVVSLKTMTRRRSSIFSSPPPPMTMKKSSQIVLLQIIAKQRPLKTINGHTVEESLQRLNLLGFSRCTVLGYIMLGFGCDRHIVTPNSFVTVDIFGRNLSRVNIQQLQVQWIEHVHGTVKGKDYTLKTVLAEVTTKNDDNPEGMGDEWLAQPKSILDDSSCCPSFSSSCCSCWWGSVGDSSKSRRGGKAEDHCCSVCDEMATTTTTTTTSEPWRKDDREVSFYGRSSVVRESYLSTMSYPQKQLRLLVPQQARYSYEGAMIKIRHELVVQVQTSGGCWVPSPSISCRTFVRPLLDDEHEGVGHYSTLWEEEETLSPATTQRKGMTQEDKDATTSRPTVMEGFEERVLVSTMEGGSTLSCPATTIIAPTIHWPIQNNGSTSASPVSKLIGSRKT
jgi:hypothetical protein